MHRSIAQATVASIAMLLGFTATGSELPDRGWSVGGQFGGALMQDMIVGYPGQDRPPYEFEYSPGWAGALMLGYRFNPRWRAEVELGTRQHELENSSPAGADADGELATLQVMTNIYRDFSGWGDLQPYVGLGIGRAWGDFQEFRVNHNELIDDRAHAWAGQLIAGMRFAPDEHWSVAVDYRLLFSGELKVADDEGSLMDPDLRSHAAFFGVHRSF